MQAHNSNNITLLKKVFLQENCSSNFTNRYLKIVVISKNQPPERLSELIKNYQVSHFGENYLQEALLKISALKTQPITWHFTGTIQHKKLKLIAQNFQWVQTVTQEKTLKKLNFLCQEMNKKIHILFQINPDNDASKSGIPIENIELINHLISLEAETPYLIYRGFMCLKKQSSTPTETTNTYQKMHTLFSKYTHLSKWDTLSMGMSNDFTEAIDAGSTMLRLGQVVFKYF